MAPLLYTAELDLAEPHIRPFLDWYAYRHAPDLVPLGFQSSACYGVTGGDMNLFDIYEIPGHEIFSGPGYARMNLRDDYAAEILAKRRNKAHTIYEQHALQLTGLILRDGLDSDWLTVARFDSPATPGEIGSILTRQLDDWNGAGVAAVRLGTRTTDHPIYTTDRPHFILALEWLARPVDGNALIVDLMRAIESKASASRQMIFEGQRLFPWPNKTQRGS
jgi:hypothetical protein